jgi:phosphate transport system permease protein
MTMIAVLLALLALGGISWFAGRAKARSFAPARGKIAHSLPGHFGLYVLIWTVVPALIALAGWNIISPMLVHSAILSDPAAAALPAAGIDRDSIISDAMNLARDPGAGSFFPLAQKLAGPAKAAIDRFAVLGAALVILMAFVGGAFGYTRIKAAFPARTRVERVTMALLLLASLIAVLTTFGIIASLIFETGRFFSAVNPLNFLFGTHWSPDTMAPATDDFNSTLGAVPLFWGTLFIGAIIAMIVAIPLGLLSAIFLTQYAGLTVRKWVKPLLEILAGIPTVVYGYFAALTVAPFVRDFAEKIGLENPSTESALAAGLVMGVMIIPFVSSMADDSLAAVPQAMRDGSLAMGATTSETVKRVLVPAALPGIIAGVMLAISRAIGETMIVVMAAGASANLSANPFQSMTTVTYQISALLTGEGSADHPTTLAAFALGLVLFCVTLVLNIIALRVVKRFREAYE